MREKITAAVAEVRKEVADKKRLSWSLGDVLRALVPYPAHKSVDTILENNGDDTALLDDGEEDTDGCKTGVATPCASGSKFPKSTAAVRIQQQWPPPLRRALRNPIYRRQLRNAWLTPSSSGLPIKRCNVSVGVTATCSLRSCLRKQSKKRSGALASSLAATTLLSKLSPTAGAPRMRPTACGSSKWPISTRGRSS